MDHEFGETVIDFEPDLNEVNFRRMEIAKLIEWLNSDDTFDSDIKTMMIDNAEKELKLITSEMKAEFENREE